MKAAIFCSGNGSNFQAICESKKNGKILSDLSLMVCDQKDAYAICRAQKEKIPYYLVEKDSFVSKIAFERAILDRLQKDGVDFIILAGYMRILSAEFIHAYKEKILNIHPSLLPKYKGAQAIKDALEDKAEVTGVTVHFVVPEVDSGPIIIQKSIHIAPDDTEETLAEKIHKIEHEIFPKAINLFETGKLSIENGKVIIQ